MQITTAADAKWHASWSFRPIDRLETFSDDSGTLLGWTFQTRQGGSLAYGWVLADGRVSSALELYRGDAEGSGRRAATGRT